MSFNSLHRGLHSLLFTLLEAPWAARLRPRDSLRLKNQDARVIFNNGAFLGFVAIGGQQPVVEVSNRFV